MRGKGRTRVLYTGSPCSVYVELRPLQDLKPLGFSAYEFDSRPGHYETKRGRSKPLVGNDYHASGFNPGIRGKRNVSQRGVMMSVGNVATIAGLKALPAPTTEVVQIVEGYADAGDGGGGTFVWDSSGGAYSSGVSFIFLLNIHGDDIISRTAGSFLADGWTKGDEVTISGTTNNNGTFRVTGVTATNLTVGGVSFTPETANATLINFGDKGTTFAPNGASAQGWWKRQFSDALNVRWFGAKGDGTTPDTASLQAAVDAAATTGGATVFIPQGVFLLAASIDLASRVSIAGGGEGSVLAMGSLGLAAQAGLLNGSLVTDFMISDITITGAGESNGISLHGCNRVRIERVSVTFSASATNTACIGIYDDGTGTAGTSSDFWVRTCCLTPSALGLLTQGDPTGPYWLENISIEGIIIDGSAAATGTFEGLKIDLHTRLFAVNNNIVRGQDNVRVGIHVEENCCQGVIVGNMIDGCTASGIRVDNGQSNIGVSDIAISSNIISDMLGVGRVGVALEGSSASVFRNIIINGNTISSVQIGVREASDDSLNLSICDNVVDEFADIGVYVRSPNTLVKGNHIRATAAVLSGAIVADTTATTCLVSGNDLAAATAAGVVVGGAGGATLMTRDNLGYATENNGTITLSSGNTTTAVIHGLAKTPALGDISVTPVEAWGNATTFWISSPTSTHFIINVDADPTQDVDFAWTASIR